MYLVLCFEKLSLIIIMKVFFIFENFIRECYIDIISTPPHAHSNPSCSPLHTHTYILFI